MRRPPVAVAFVLLPPAPVARRAVALSRALGSELRLGPRARPHITLAMACVPAAAVPGLVAALWTIAGRTPPLPLTVEAVIGHRSARHVTAWYTIGGTRALSALHRNCLAAAAAVPRRRPTAGAFVRPPGRMISASARRWVARFAEDASLRRYRPHVTLGRGVPPADPALPLRFRARRLALCHLGPDCTCAAVLAETRLRSAPPR